LRFTATKTLTIFITPAAIRRHAAVFRPCRGSAVRGPSSTRRTASRIASISAISLSLGEANIHHCERGCSSSTARVILVSFLKPFGPAMPLAVFQKLRQTAVNVTVENRLFVVAVLGKTLDLFPFDRQSALRPCRRRAG